MVEGCKPPWHLLPTLKLLFQVFVKNRARSAAIIQSSCHGLFATALDQDSRPRTQHILHGCFAVRFELFPEQTCQGLQRGQDGRENGFLFQLEVPTLFTFSNLGNQTE